jgi:hypothetical protein
MSKLNKILIVLVLVLAVVLAGVFYWQKVGFEKPYWAVYVNDGNVYFGKISHFPKFVLNDVWFLQNSANSPELTISKFNEAVWGPGDKLYINQDNIIWKIKLREDSQLLTRFKGK